MLTALQSINQPHRGVQPSFFFKLVEGSYTCGRFIWGLLMIGIASDANQKDSWTESMQEVEDHFKASQEHRTPPSFLVRWGLCSAPRNMDGRDAFTLSTDMNKHFSIF